MQNYVAVWKNSITANAKKNLFSNYVLEKLKKKGKIITNLGFLIQIVSQMLFSFQPMLKKSKLKMVVNAFWM